MPPKSRPGIGQEALPELAAETPSPIRNMGAPNALARAATPEYWSLDLADYADITPRMIEAAAPDRLRRSLINPQYGSSNQFVVTYETERGGWRRVPLNADEYRVISRTPNPAKYGEQVMAATMGGKKSLVLAGQELQREAEEDELHSITQKNESMRNYVDRTLLTEANMLERLIEAAKHHWWSRGNEDRMRQDLTTFRQLIIPNMLRVIGHQRKLSGEQMELAARSIDYRLFFMRSRNGHIQNWKDMLTLARDYDQEKIAVFRDRIGRFTGYLATHGKTVRHE